MVSSQLDSRRPRLFLGSSTASLHVAQILGAGLADVAELTTWCEGEATPSARGFDAAAFVLCPEPGHEVFLRLGVFLGVLGRERIVVCPAFAGVELPAELRDLAATPQASAVTERLRRISLPATPPDVPMPDTREIVRHVARRRRRSLGSASSDRPGQSLRIADISLTGALLETYGEIPEHQVLDLQLTLDNGRSLRVTAKVVRIQHPQWGRVGGVGVAFTHFAGDARQVLEQFLDDDPAIPPS